jgi:hypothetical protein
MKEFWLRPQHRGDDPKIIERDGAHPCNDLRRYRDHQVARVPKCKSECPERCHATKHEGASNLVQALEFLQMTGDDVADGLDRLGAGHEYDEGFGSMIAAEDPGDAGDRHYAEQGRNGAKREIVGESVLMPGIGCLHRAQLKIRQHEYRRGDG